MACLMRILARCACEISRAGKACSHGSVESLDQESDWADSVIRHADSCLATTIHENFQNFMIVNKTLSTCSRIRVEVVCNS